MSSDYYSAASRLARAHAERDRSGWSWENAPRRRMAMIRLVLSTKGRTCHLCGTPGATTADHVIPRARGGLNTLDNLEPAHVACNLSRKDRPLDEWFAAHPVHPRTLAPSRSW